MARARAPGSAAGRTPAPRYAHPSAPASPSLHPAHARGLATGSSPIPASQRRDVMDAIVRTRQGVVQGNMGQGVAAFKGILTPPPRSAIGFSHLSQPSHGRACAKRSPMARLCPRRLVAPLRRTHSGDRSARSGVPQPQYLVAGPQQGRLPVMVWIHGGAFSNGSGSNPSLMARASPAMASSVSPSTIGWEPRASSSGGRCCQSRLA